VGTEMVVGGDTAVEVIWEGKVVVVGGTGVAIVGGDVDVVDVADLEVVVVTVPLTIVFEPHAVSPIATRATPATVVFAIAWPFMPKCYRSPRHVLAQGSETLAPVPWQNRLTAAVHAQTTLP
jgi:hypothetical protein